jgi:hypothetical protein
MGYGVILYAYLFFTTEGTEVYTEYHRAIFDGSIVNDK